MEEPYYKSVDRSCVTSVKRARVYGFRVMPASSKRLVIRRSLSQQRTNGDGNADRDVAGRAISLYRGLALCSQCKINVDDVCYHLNLMR